jgi:two-component system LytT family response regulator
MLDHRHGTNSIERWSYETAAQWILADTTFCDSMVTSVRDMDGKSSMRTAERSELRAMKLLIVDGEPAVRASLIELCGHHRDLLVVGEATSGAKAIQTAQVLRPDLMLLDVQLPDMSGFDVLRALRAREQHRAILVTANTRDSATAFAAGAIDCLMKPVSAEAFSISIARARARFGARAGGSPRFPRAAGLPMWHHGIEQQRPVFLVGEREHRLYPLDPERIDYIESAGNYVKYRIANIEYIARESIKRLDALLGPLGFVRIERSLLLNIRAIAYTQPIGHGTFAFTLLSGARLHSGHAYRDGILACLPLRRRTPARADKLQPAVPATVRARASLA